MNTKLETMAESIKRLISLLDPCLVGTLHSDEKNTILADAEETVEYLEKMNNGEVCQVVSIDIEDGTVQTTRIQANVAVLAHIQDYDINDTPAVNLKQDIDGRSYIPIQSVFIPEKSQKNR